MKVKMKHTMASPSGIVKVGEVADLSSDLAQALIRDDYAEAVETAEAPVVEAEEVILADVPAVVETAEAPVVADLGEAKKKGKKS